MEHPAHRRRHRRAHRPRQVDLVKALTGIDPDRLKEEQERGLTIDLGFARCELPDGRMVGIVDVPGHERFVQATWSRARPGIDLVVLVVAADDGVMPQTREHLAIMQLLGVERGFVALTKIDLVEPSTGRARGRGRARSRARDVPRGRADRARLGRHRRGAARSCARALVRAGAGDRRRAPPRASSACRSSACSARTASARS